MANQGGLFGSYVATNFILDAQRINETNVNSPEFKKFIVDLYQIMANVAQVLNTKDTGVYTLEEFVNSQLYFPNPTTNSGSVTSQAPIQRNVIRKVLYYTTGLPNTGTVTIPHGIACSSLTTFTRIYGCSSDITGLNYIPLPYASPTLANNIELKVDATNVTIITGSNRTNFTQTYVVLEYLQN